MSRPVTLIGVVVLVVAVISFFTRQLSGDDLILVVAVGALLAIAGLWQGR